MILHSHPMGNANSRYTLQALVDNNMLAQFWTCIEWNGDSLLAKVAPGSLRRQFERRTFPDTGGKTHTFPWREAGRLFAMRAGWNGLTKHETGYFSVDAIVSSLDRRVAAEVPRLNNLQGVFASEDCALATFRAAKQRNIARIYEMPIAYWEESTRLLREEAERWPEWEPTLVGTRNSEAKFARKTEEMDLADVVVAPSGFVYDSIPEAAKRSKTCVVAPFGSPALPESGPDTVDESGPLRVLFAGSLTQRKGLADLFQAIKLVNRKDVELIVLGSPVAPLEFYQRQGVEFTYEAPRPHADVLKLMRSCHVLALPSIVEGRALVQQEALACGLPLLVTPNAGGEDLIEEGRTGFLVPIRSPEKLAEKINFMADNRSNVLAMRRHAREKAAEYTWERYGGTVVEAVRDFITTRNS